MVAPRSIWRPCRETRWWRSWSNLERGEGNLKSRQKRGRASIDSLQAVPLEDPICRLKSSAFEYNSIDSCNHWTGEYSPAVEGFSFPIYEDGSLVRYTETMNILGP